MALKRIVQSLDEVPESVREFYVESEGKFVLDADDAAELKSALRRKTDRAQQLAEELKKFEGIDLDRYNELMSAAEQQAADEMKKKGDWEAREKQLIDRHRSEVEKAKQREASLLSALENALITESATRAIAAAKGEPTLLLPHVEKRAKVVEENGEFVVRIIDPATKQPLLADGTGTPMQMSGLIESFKSDATLARAFEPPDKSGSGASGAARTNSGGKRIISRSEVPKHLEAVISGDVVVQE